LIYENKGANDTV